MVIYSLGFCHSVHYCQIKYCFHLLKLYIIQNKMDCKLWIWHLLAWCAKTRNKDSCTVRRKVMMCMLSWFFFHISLSSIIIPPRPQQSAQISEDKRHRGRSDVKASCGMRLISVWSLSIVCMSLYGGFGYSGKRDVNPQLRKCTCSFYSQACIW